jgi:hypothetical protein
MSESDLGGGGSDRLVDSVIAWGSDDEITRRIRGQLAAGADQVVLQPVGIAEGAGPLIEAYARLAAIMSLVGCRR